MDAMNHRMHSRRVATGTLMFRRAVMAGILVSTLLTALPSVTFADGRDRDGRDDRGRHSLVQQPYGQPPHNAGNPFVTMQAQIDALKAQVDQLTLTVGKLATPEALSAMKNDISVLQGTVTALDKKSVDIVPGLADYLKVDKTAVFQGVNGPHILITGANVHVRSGSGATDNNAAPFTGLGNLIIGYNENTSPTPTLLRTGSHNLVGGSMHSFSSYGGTVFGYQNTISGPYANVVGGSANLAQGPNSTVYGSASQRAVNLNSYAPVQGARPAPGQ
jgi:hypothetical protein